MSDFELERVTGTSTRMLKKHYGTLLDGATAGKASRLAAFEGERNEPGIGLRASANDVWATITPEGRRLRPPSFVGKRRFPAHSFSASDGTRTRDLRRDRPAL
jgi:hypothetical protein